MKYGSLVEFVGTLPCFDLAVLVQGFDEPRDIIRVQLARWMKAGKVIGLRRGMYTLPEDYRRAPVTPALLANQLYRPSYLSGLWALGFYDMIPERVVWLTSVTPRGPRRFENPFGVFDYRTIKRDAFFGYATVPHGGQQVLVAEPEKALLDHWHLTPGEWTEERLTEMRYQYHDRVNEAKLRDCATRFRNPRLRRASERWLRLARVEEKGTVTL
jgi:predicted transcriptional regulator of viral defense system